MWATDQKAFRRQFSQNETFFFLFNLDVLVTQSIGLHFLLCKLQKTLRYWIPLTRYINVLCPHVPPQSEGCVTVLRMSPSWQLKSAEPVSPWWKWWESNSSTAEALIHPVKALCILNGNVKFLPQFLKRFIGRQVQSIKALGRDSKDNEEIHHY